MEDVGFGKSPLVKYRILKKIIAIFHA